MADMLPGARQTNKTSKTKPFGQGGRAAGLVSFVATGLPYSRLVSGGNRPWLRTRDARTSTANVVRYAAVICKVQSEQARLVVGKTTEGRRSSKMRRQEGKDDRNDCCPVREAATRAQRHIVLNQRPLKIGSLWCDQHLILKFREH
jgi:hypothetical protein